MAKSFSLAGAGRWRRGERSLRRPFLVAPAHRPAEPAGVVRPIALVGWCGRCSFPDVPRPLAEPKGRVGPVVGGSLRLAQLLLETVFHRLRGFFLGCRGARILGKRGDRPKLSAKR